MAHERRRRLYALAMTVLLVPALAVAKIEPPELRVETHELDNGLRVLLHEDHSVPVVNLQLRYHVGSKNETEGRSGFAHLFEHMMFQGSENMEPREHSDYIKAIGGRNNAGTSFDYTIYWQTFPSNYLERVIWMEADRLRSLKVLDDRFKAQRDVVKEERRVRYENPPYGRLAEVVFDALYDTHPYEITPIGTMDDLNAAGIEDVQAFHSEFYVPNNATLVIAGDFDPEQALAWVKKHFGVIPRGEEIAREFPQEPPQSTERRVVEYDSKAPLPAVIIGYHVPEDGHPDLYPLQVAGNILSFGQSSRLYKKLVYDQQIALQAAGLTFALEDPGAFIFFTIMNQGREAAEGEASLLEEVERLKTEPVTERELQKAKNQFISELVFDRQTVQQKADALSYADVILGDSSLVNTQLAAYQKVTAEDIQRVAEKYFKEANRTVVYMLPEASMPAPEETEEEQAEEAAR
jgi:predicted Zn-dependent peptidase